MRAAKEYHRKLAINEAVAQYELRDVVSCLVRRLSHGHGLRISTYAEVQVIEFFPKISDFMHQVLDSEIRYSVLKKFKRLRIVPRTEEQIQVFMEQLGLLCDSNFVLHYTAIEGGLYDISILFDPPLGRRAYEQLRWVASEMRILPGAQKT